MLSSIEYLTTPEKSTPQILIEDFAAILQSFDLNYSSLGIYYRVGEIKATQGWIIHLSIILSQVKHLLETIIPFLVNKSVVFKIPASNAVCDDIMGGNLGVSQIGKIVSIYCEDTQYTSTLARELISLTERFKGPAIPTDICLGNIVYTRYGSFNPIIKLDSSGVQRKYIYDEHGQLIEDSYEIPFRLPDRVPWPFNDLAAPVPPQPATFYNRLYKVTDIIKQDPRGNVYKGLYLKNLLTVKKCIIKQGFSNMASDPEGRDIQERLRWQNELHRKLSDTIPLPKIYDIYQEQGFTVLIMEYITGCSLFEKLAEINSLSKYWQDLTISDSLRITNYALGIANYINKIHKKGYTHRDINPVNFLIGKKDSVILIDIELAYSLKDKKPDPPFRQGTPGFMSPQQANFLSPTIFDDIYGLGATLLFIFTGLLPVQCNSESTRIVFEHLNFLIGNQKIAELISNCLHADVKERPTIDTIIETLRAYNATLQLTSGKKASRCYSDLANSQSKEIISSALSGLAQLPVITMNDLWLSKQITAENPNTNRTMQFAAKPGLSDGLSGVLYVLARLHRAGFPIDSCMQGFTKAWQTVKTKYFNKLLETPPGLFNGTAGFALAIAEGIRSGLLEDNDLNKEKIVECLRLKACGVNLADGIAGQGLSILRCKDFLKEDIFDDLINNIVDELLRKQQKNGSWLGSSPPKKSTQEQILDIGFDDTGIAMFLLEYLCLQPNDDVKISVSKAIGNLVSNKRYMAYLTGNLASKSSYDFGDGGKGTVLLLLEAYDILRVDNYRKIAIAALLQYPPRIIHPNFTQQNGLAAIGELYLEAHRVLKTEEWKTRADWIANTYVHTICRNQNGSGYWVMEQNNAPTASLMNGISGIIHFLARCVKPEKIGYRLFK